MEKKEYWITNSRFKLIVLILFLMFCIFMFLIYARGTEIANDPCQICADRLKEDVICSSGYGLEQKVIIFEAQKTFEEYPD